MSKKSKWQKQQTAAPRALPVATAPALAAASPFIAQPEPLKRLTYALGSCLLVRAKVCDAPVTLTRLELAP